MKLFRLRSENDSQKLNVNLETLPLQELYTIIKNNPGLLRRPIIWMKNDFKWIQ